MALPPPAHRGRAAGPRDRRAAHPRRGGAPGPPAVALCAGAGGRAPALSRATRPDVAVLNDTRCRGIGLPILRKLCIGDAKSGVGASTLTREGARQAQKLRYRPCFGADVPPSALACDACDAPTPDFARLVPSSPSAHSPALPP